jgi:hypothetical protein
MRKVYEEYHLLGYGAVLSVELQPAVVVIGSICFPPAYLLDLAELFPRPWRWWRYIPLKRRLQLSRLHAVISQKMIPFITTAVETSNPTGKLMLVCGNNEDDVGGSTGVDSGNYESSLCSFNRICVPHAATRCSKYRLRIRKMNEIRRTEYPQTRTRS